MNKRTKFLLTVLSTFSVLFLAILSISSSSQNYVKKTVNINYVQALLEQNLSSDNSNFTDDPSLLYLYLQPLLEQNLSSDNSNFTDDPNLLYLLNHTAQIEQVEYFSKELALKISVVDEQGNKYHLYVSCPDKDTYSAFILKSMESGIKCETGKARFVSVFIRIFGDTLKSLIFIGIWLAAQKFLSSRIFSQNSSIVLTTKNQNTQKFSDVIGLESAKHDLKNLVKYLQNPQSLRKYNTVHPKGYVFTGPPGNGKTMLARALAGEAGVSFIAITGNSFTNPYYGVSQQIIRNTFELAAKNAPCIIFIDELDSLAPNRATSRDYINNITNEVLSCIDGFKLMDQVVVVGATNLLESIDPALLRPGRMDNIIKISEPNLKERKMFIQHFNKTYNIVDSRDKELAPLTHGLSGAAMVKLYRQAAIFAEQEASDIIQYKHVQESLQNLLLGGAVNVSVTLSEADKKLIAYHESGHAILANHFGFRVPLLTITPRGSTLGITLCIPNEQDAEYDHVLDSHKNLNKDIVVLMGGRAAEEIVFGKDKCTSGAYSDIKRASNIARKLVAILGLNDSIGPVSCLDDYGANISPLFSEHNKSLVEEQVSSIIKKNYQQAIEILAQSRDKMDALAAALMKKDIVEQQEFLKIMSTTEDKQEEQNEENFDSKQEKTEDEKANDQCLAIQSTVLGVS